MLLFNSTGVPTPIKRAKRQELCKRPGILLYALYTHASMEALKTALEDGASTVAWSIVHAALEEQRVAASDGSAALPKGTPTDEPRFHLDSASLWKQFFAVTNEMIVTKAGRRMFPVLKLHLSQLDPSALYAVLLEFRCTNQHRWRFLNGCWQKGSSCEDNAEQRHAFVHFTSLAPGSQWMQEPISFAKLKLSNRENGTSKIKLNSLHKYQPHIHLVKMNKQNSDQKLHIKSFTFPETQFIAVTAYQNDKVTQMKIKNNPFAKAFLGGSASERIHCGAPYSSPFELQHTMLTRIPPLLPATPPHSLTPPPPPYPSSSLSPSYIHPTGRFHGYYSTAPQQQQTPPLMSHDQFVYHDCQSCIEVYDATSATVSGHPNPQTCIYESVPYFTPEFTSDYPIEPPYLYLHDDTINNPLPTTPSTASTISAASDEQYYAP